MLLPILYEDNHLLVVNKPCGLATMGVGPDEPSVVRQAAKYIKEKYQKPGNVYVGVVSRLDALVSGVLVLARTTKAASRLSDQIRRQSTTKRYVAVVEGNFQMADDIRTLEHYIAKNEARHCMEVVSHSLPGAQVAVLSVRPLVQSGDMSIVEIELVTGRKHQIRVQLSALGHPIVGDQKYDAKRRWPIGIGLHCYRYDLDHPTRQERMRFQTPPDHWPKAIGADIYSRMRTILEQNSV